MNPEELKKLNEAVTAINTYSKKLDEFLNVYFRTHFIDKTVFDKKTYFDQTATFNVPFVLKDGSTITLGSTTGGKIGATGDKLGFLGATPIVRQSAITAPSGGATQDAESRTAITSLINALKNFGLTS